MIIDIDEKKIRIKMEGDASIKWFLDLDAVAVNELPFVNIEAHTITAEFEGKSYDVKAIKGSFFITPFGILVKKCS